jgi:hypothetical protein
MPPSNAYLCFLAEFRHGASANELTAAQQECVAAAEATGKPAKMYHCITYTPTGGAIAVQDKIELKLPSAQRDQAIFFPTEEHTLSRSDPKQRELELRPVPSPEPVELRQVQAVPAS